MFNKVVRGFQVTDFCFKENYDVNDLIQIMQLLRKPGGCPWDREQTHSSIKKNFIEETYEVIEAINKKDIQLLKEELGDVLLQVVFHAQIEDENGAFNFDDVSDGICKKLIVRHPHIFSDVTVSSSDDVLQNWDAIKKRTKGLSSETDSLSSVPKELPSLMRAAKVQQRAAKAGFDWDDAGGAFEKLSEEISELKEAVDSGVKAEMDDEFGDVLFSMVNVSRFLKIDAEECLGASTEKFIGRFAIVEQLCKQRQIDMSEASLSDLDCLWEEAKKLYSSAEIADR